LVLAAEALGYAAVWRTGAFAEDQALVHDLGGGDNEQFVGFIYVGSRDCPSKPLPDLALSDFHRVW
jgi:nitroreductase